MTTVVMDGGLPTQDQSESEPKDTKMDSSTAKPDLPTVAIIGAGVCGLLLAQGLQKASEMLALGLTNVD